MTLGEPACDSVDATELPGGLGMARIIATVLAALLLVSACGGDDEPSNANRPDDGVEPTPEVAGISVEAPTPTAVVVEAPAADQLTYTVQPGDTVGLIAANFGVSVEDLVAANGLENADLISIDQELIIPAAPSE